MSGGPRFSVAAMSQAAPSSWLRSLGRCPATMSHDRPGYI